MVPAFARVSACRMLAAAGVRSGLSRSTIKRMRSKGLENSTAGNVDAVRRVLEAAGVEVITENGGGGRREAQEGVGQCYAGLR